MDLASDPSLPPLPTRARAVAWATLLAGTALLTASAAHFADVSPYDADAAFLAFLAGAPLFLVGLVLQARVPAAPALFRRLLREEPVPMQLAIRPLEGKPGEDVPYLACLWRLEQHRGQEAPALELMLARDEGGVPWFAHVHDGQQARVYGAARRRGPVVLEVGERLLLPLRPRAVKRR